MLPPWRDKSSLAFPGLPALTGHRECLRAIRVDNMRNEKIGHIRRELASRLSPLMDRDGLTIEGYVQGVKGAYTMPIDVICLGSSSSKAAVCMKLRCDRELWRGDVYGRRHEMSWQPPLWLRRTGFELGKHLTPGLRACWPWMELSLG